MFDIKIVGNDNMIYPTAVPTLTLHGLSITLSCRWDQTGVAKERAESLCGALTKGLPLRDHYSWTLYGWAHNASPHDPTFRPTHGMVYGNTVTGRITTYPHDKDCATKKV